MAPDGNIVADAFDRVGQVLATAPGTEALLARVAQLAVETVDGCTGASVTAAGDGGPVTIATAPESARAIDLVQIERGAGPTLEVVAGSALCYSVDLESETRWGAVPHAIWRSACGASSRWRSPG